MTNPPTIGVALLGLGTVGQGVWKHLTAQKPALEARLGVRIAVRGVAVRRRSRRRAARVPARLLTTDARRLVDDPKVGVVIELIGGTGAARALVLRALRAGKTVITANKALLCEHGPEILAAAKAGKASLFLEGSVGGGIPIVKTLREGLVANRFDLIVGIVNGTSNYILTRMGEDGLTFEAALAEARAEGYAEADPSLDVDGVDAWHKAAILGFLAHGKWAPRRRALVEGIRKVSAADIGFARKFGYTLKHLAVVRRDLTAGWMSVGVYPALVPSDDILAKVSGVNNGITLRGDVVGVTTLAGPGAGADATASAVLGDLADALLEARGGSRPVADLHALAKAGRAVPMAPEEAIVSPFYLRLTLRDTHGVLAGIYRTFARHKVSIARVVQYEHPDTGTGTLTLSTYPGNERDMARVVAELARLRTVLEPPTLLRIFAP
jgi:homoserine dehydrogenase